MEHWEFDSLSGMYYDFLNALVFNFFPFSVIGTHRGDEDNFVTDVLNKNVMTTGSLAENLNLPVLQDKNSGKIYQPDIDGMHSLRLNLEAGFIPHSKTIVHRIIDEDFPLHCYIAMSLQQPGVPKIIVSPFSGETDFMKYLQDNVQTLKHCTTYTQPNHEIVFSKDGHYSDYVPCISVSCPDSIIKKLQLRSENTQNTCMPALSVVPEDLKQNNIHAVFKPHEKSPDPEHQFRLSFSLLEKQLALSLNDVQRTAYRVVKGLVKSEINDKALNDDGKLPTYLLKTTLFWLCEGLPRGFCTRTNIGKVFLALLDKLLHFIVEGNLPHYFIPEGNLIDKYGSDTLHTWIKGIQQIRLNPFEAMLRFWGTYEIAHSGGEFFCDALIKSSIRFKINLIEKGEKTELTDKSLQALVQSRTFLNHIELLHVEAQNIIDIVRLYLFKKNIICHCTNQIMVDVDKGCKLCLISDFCQRTEIEEELKLYMPVLMPEVANMWYVRSLLDIEHREIYKQKGEKLFTDAKDVVKDVTYFTIHHCLFLMAEGIFEEVVHDITELLTLHPPSADDYILITRFLSDMLDPLLQIKLSGNPCIKFSTRGLLYHLLCSCYIRAGVQSEIIWPIIRDYESTSDVVCYRGFLGADSKAVVADQYVLKEDYYQALMWYAFAYGRFVIVCVANLFNKKNISKTMKLLKVDI